ncbi:xanthine phosphoribosyltransferase, partial [Clostridium perfringens]
MVALKENILKEGKVREGNILKFDCFLNHKMDIKFLNEVGKEFSKRFEGEK